MGKSVKGLVVERRNSLGHELVASPGSCELAARPYNREAAISSQPSLTTTRLLRPCGQAWPLRGRLKLEVASWRVLGSLREATKAAASS